jgi:hypothetical protein
MGHDNTGLERRGVLRRGYAADKVSPSVPTCECEPQRAIMLTVVVTLRRREHSAPLNRPQRSRTTMAAQGAATQSTARKLRTKPSRSAPSSFWMRRLKELAVFKKKFGHCCISTLDKEQASLGCWVRYQRGQRRRGRLNAEQIQGLDELGFAWDVSLESLPYVVKRQQRAQLQWESMCDAVAIYRQEHGRCPALSGLKARSSLERWVVKQRSAKRKGKLSEDQVRRLDELGFVWDVVEERWERMFTELVEIKKAHGSCNVPTSWIENPELAMWVLSQRVQYRTGRLLPERRKRLEAIGFRWIKRRR